MRKPIFVWLVVVALVSCVSCHQKTASSTFPAMATTRTTDDLRALSPNVLSRLSHPGAFELYRDSVTRGRATPVETLPADAISICSFNIQFLGNSKERDNKALASVLKDFDVVVVQELVAPPYAGKSS